MPPPRMSPTMKSRSSVGVMARFSSVSGPGWRAAIAGTHTRTRRLMIGGEAMAREWRNWAGDQACRPAAIERPRSRDELLAVVAGARERGVPVRAAGSGHSFTDIACTDGVMLRLEA